MREETAMTRAKANSIVNEFFAAMNPTHWNGKGANLTFINKVWKHSVSASKGLVITISGGDVDGWHYHCTLTDENDQVLRQAKCKNIDSAMELADTVLLLCADEETK